ncbi:branched-chain amino acid transporter AzlD [Spirochaetia bacterium]|nr:branched-chain amino acid transporter AzlD [Spirochaetia bacterium]
MLSIREAFVYTFVLGAVIFLCRVVPFIIFGKERNTRENPPGGGVMRSFLGFVEAVAPPVAMTVLAVNTLALPLKGLPDLSACIPLGAAALFTAAVHLWKRNALISIFGGTALYMVLERILGSA